MADTSVSGMCPPHPALIALLQWLALGMASGCINLAKLEQDPELFPARSSYPFSVKRSSPRQMLSDNVDITQKRKIK